MYTKKVTFLTGLFIILGSLCCEASQLKIVNHTILSTNSWPAKAVIKVNDKSVMICSKESTICPNESLMGIPANKTSKVEIIRYIFGNVVLHIDASCNREFIPNPKETIKFDLYGSPSNNIGYGSTIFCNIQRE